MRWDETALNPAEEQQPRAAATAQLPEAFQLEKQELAWLLAHPDFARSASLVRFLNFICTRYFEGESDEIREFSIAVEALGRKAASFDSHVDPIVRVTARALRKKLKEIYSGDGKDRPLRIVLPLGHYVPQFVPHGATLPAEAEAEVAEASESSSEAAENNHVLHVKKAEGPAAFLRVHQSLIVKVAIGLGAMAAVFVSGFFLGRRADKPAPVLTDNFQWGDSVWSDEFNGAAQQMPDPGVWAYQTGNQEGWGNKEQEIYCSPSGASPKPCDAHRPNVFEDGQGHLVVRAQHMPDGSWTSARLTTKGLKVFQYGRIEARIKMPVGSGLWPSFWMLGAAFDSVGWPAAGSVDIAENVSLTPKANGLGPQMIRSTVHGPRYFGGNGHWHDYRLPNGARVDDGSFHTYGVIWSPGMIQFYVDDPANIFFVDDSSSIPEGGQWVFDKPFFLVLNLAVGGEWPGNPGAGTPDPADMLVDYVRVYNNPTVPAPGIQWQPLQIKSGSSAASIVSLQARRYAGRVHMTCATDSPATTCALGSSVVNFSDTLNQEDTLTLSTESFGDKGRTVTPPGRYKVTITATTISGDHSQLTVPFQVTSAE